jgi:hypothetical protein
LATLALAATVALGLTIGVAAGAIVRGAGASFGEFARQVSSQIGPSVPLAFFNLDDDSAIAFLFDVRRHVPVVEPVSADRPCDPPEPGFYLVSELAWEQQTCFHDAPWVALARGGPTVASQRWRRLVLARYGSPVD